MLLAYLAIAVFVIILELLAIFSLRSRLEEFQEIARENLELYNESVRHNDELSESLQNSREERDALIIQRTELTNQRDQLNSLLHISRDLEAAIARQVETINGLRRSRLKLWNRIVALRAAISGACEDAGTRKVLAPFKAELLSALESDERGGAK